MAIRLKNYFIITREITLQDSADNNIIVRRINHDYQDSVHKNTGESGFPLRMETLLECVRREKVGETDSLRFLKGIFDVILDEMISAAQKGEINLRDTATIQQLTNFLEMMHLLPARRVRMEAPRIYEEFYGHILNFYKIMSIPQQDAETSFSFNWVLPQLEYYERHAKKASMDRISDILEICEALIANGSYKIRAELASVAISLSSELDSKMMLPESKRVRAIAIQTLSEENPWIEQREAKLYLMLDKEERNRILEDESSCQLDSDFRKECLSL